ncbi:MAG: NAD+ synthase, partial [Deltaproteobacteria bacterium]|nr:NAD+ synthase [Deltaproteobacteria bacterium]
MKIGLAQVNPTVGDFAGNRRLVENATEEAWAEGAELVIFPELVLTGYPPLDLLSRPGFIEEQDRQIEALLPLSEKVPLVIGAVTQSGETDGHEKGLLNTALLLSGGKRMAQQAKSLLPTYDVFDEKRYFAPAQSWEPVQWKDAAPALGMSICEDVWTHALSYPFDPIEAQVQAGAEVILNLSA